MEGGRVFLLAGMEHRSSLVHACIKNDSVEAQRHETFIKNLWIKQLTKTLKNS